MVRAVSKGGAWPRVNRRGLVSLGKREREARFDLVGTYPWGGRSFATATGWEEEGRRETTIVE